MKVARWLIIGYVSWAVTAAAALPDINYSPPGIELSYWKMDHVISSTKYDDTRTWYKTAHHSFLLPTFKDTDDYKFITISTFEKWYCVDGFPTRCASLDGLDGILLNNPKGHVWPKSKS